MKSIAIVSLSARAACVCHLFLNSLHHAIHGGTARTFHQYSGISLPAIQNGLHRLFMALDLLGICSETPGVAFATGTHRQQAFDTLCPGVGAYFLMQRLSAFTQFSHGAEYGHPGTRTG